MTPAPKPAPKAKRPRKPLKPKKRNAAEFRRVYGSKQRVAWVKSLPCICGRWACTVWPIEVAHVVTGGLSRKADACFTVPLCTVHHAQLHAVGVRTFQRVYSLDLERLAAITEKLWQLHTTPKRES